MIEIMMIEILRSGQAPGSGRLHGMLAALADPQLSIALRAMHSDISKTWTVAELARRAGMSRSIFAARFGDVVGKGPIEYLLTWRMAVAKDSLKSGAYSLSEIAFAVGYQSASAFSTAFSRNVGYSPKRFAASIGKSE